jgi:exodeoxyribonuclease VII small subunit
MATYQEMTIQLDTLVAELQNSNLDIDEALKKYEEANKLISKMEVYLKTSENKIKKIKSAISDN